MFCNARVMACSTIVMSKERDYALDAYRVFLMCGICFLHVSGPSCHHATPLLSNLFYWCVPGFVLISGWFGLTFSVGKPLRLYGLALYAALIAYCCMRMLHEPFNVVDAVRMFRSYWFLNSYVVLLLLSPALNRLCDDYSSSWVLPLLAIPFVWGFLAAVPWVCHFVPQCPSISPYSPFMMIGVYVVGRFLRKHEAMLNAVLKFKGWIYLSVLGCVVLCAVGLCEYTSPFSMVLAIVTFYWCRRSLLMRRLGMLLGWSLPSLFTIYLLHSRQAFGLAIISNCEAHLIERGVPLLCVYLIMTIVVFSVCLLADMPRRLLSWLLFRSHMGLTHHFRKDKRYGREYT